MDAPQRIDEVPAASRFAEVLTWGPSLIGVIFVYLGIDRLLWVGSADRTGEEKLVIRAVFAGAVVIGAALILADVLRRRGRSIFVPVPGGVAHYRHGGLVSGFPVEELVRDDVPVAARMRAIFAAACVVAASGAFVLGGGVSPLQAAFVLAPAVAFCGTVVWAQLIPAVVSVPAGKRRRRVRLSRSALADLTSGYMEHAA